MHAPKVPSSAPSKVTIRSRAPSLSTPAARRIIRDLDGASARTSTVTAKGSRANAKPCPAGSGASHEPGRTTTAVIAEPIRGGGAAGSRGPTRPQPARASAPPARRNLAPRDRSTPW